MIEIGVFFAQWEKVVGFLPISTPPEWEVIRDVDAGSCANIHMLVAKYWNVPDTSFYHFV